ncbi:hypothetical protein ACEWY4_026911 [Coilia grayii]|uniref:Ig-like domain-containing protein n=1 Tax=Coilia grayii TaxID=363190 RepID=A0ABD1IQY7_9TELE
MYLCKDGVGIKMENVTGSQEVVFDLPDVKKEDSGMYGCVCSERRQKASEVTAVGKYIIIHVNDFEVANVFITNPLITEGDSVDIVCFVPERKRQNTFHVYLCKDRFGVNILAVHGSGEAFFTLTQVKVEDSGNYNCLFSIKQHPYQRVTSTKENSMTLKVTGFRPAEIFSRQTEVLEGDTLKLRCAVFQTNDVRRDELYVYLSKNGARIRMGILRSSKETVFKVHSIKKDDSGNYSCAYSVHRYSTDRVTVVGGKAIFIHVQDFLVANIFISPTVSKGDDVEVKCAVSERESQTPVYMHLCKNVTVVKMKRVPESGVASFTLTQVTREDSGNYSCVYSTKDYSNGTVRSTHKNSAFIQVTGDVSHCLISVCKTLSLKAH